jgi:ABC-2 type transport system ATP-binding protein
VPQPAIAIPEPTAGPIVEVRGVRKTYASGFVALQGIDLSIRRGEIFALLGPNGAGKTTLINIICGIVTASGGSVTADGHDIVRDYRAARSKIGLVPQELHTDAFESVWATVTFSRGLFGRAPDAAHCERVLRDLSLWDRKDAKIMTLSGGMKRRVMIAKALSHEPTILFLDEPTAGVDVELRREMWQLVRRLRDSGVTVILTTHYIEEAEEMADRIGVINKGELIVVEDKALLMRKLGKKQLTVQLQQPLASVPAELAGYALELGDNGHALVFTFDAHSRETGIPTLLKRLSELRIDVRDLHSSESSLEDIFVSLVSRRQ